MPVADRHIGRLVLEVVPGEARALRFTDLDTNAPGVTWTAKGGRDYSIDATVTTDSGDVVVSFAAGDTKGLVGQPWRLYADGLEAVGDMVRQALPQAVPAESSVAVLLADESSVTVTVELGGGGGVSLSDTAAAALAASASAGVATTASRSDHVHARPTAAAIGAATTAQGAKADTAIQPAGLIDYLADQVEYVGGSISAGDTYPAGDTTFTADAPSVWVSYAERTAVDLDTWPDGCMSYDATADAWFASNGGVTARWTDDLAGGEILDTVTHTAIAISGIDADYAGISSVFRHPSHPTILLGTYHAEHYGTGDLFYSYVGLARSTDDGVTWTSLGHLIDPAIDYDDTFTDHGTIEVGGPQALISGDYLYVWHKDYTPAGYWQGLCVSRVAMTAIATAASSSTLPLAYKWSGSGFDQPGLGGLAADIWPGPLPHVPRWFDIAHTDDGRFLLVHSTKIPDTSGAWGISARVLADPVTVGRRGVLVADQSTAETPYVSIIDRPVESGTAFRIAYTRSVAGYAGTGGDRWTDGTVQLVTATWSDPDRPEGWQDVDDGDLLNSWVRVIPSGVPVRYRRHHGNLYVQIPLLTGGATGTACFNLPAGYRPETMDFGQEVTPIMITADGSVAGIGTATVEPDGDVLLGGDLTTYPVVTGATLICRLSPT